MGIEPTLRAWEAPILPLNYTRKMGNYTGLQTIYPLFHERGRGRS